MLYRQDASDTAEPSGKDLSIQLVKTYSLDYVETQPKIVEKTNRFTVSESGVIGISCNEKPSLSLMYPNRATVTLSNEVTYLSATFVKFSGKEYLAAARLEDGCLHLWDIESKTYRQVFDPKLPNEKHFKYMIICKIDDSTIGYGEVYPSLDGSRRVFILKRDPAEELTLSSTLKLFTEHNIWDMCHIEIPDGTVCLLLCVPRDNRIMAVGMEDGKTRWEVGKEQMGERFYPWSICTDEDNCAYVANCGRNKIRVLSVADGAVIKQIDVGGFYGINNIFCVRFHDQYLYVEYKINYEKYAIVKFKQIKRI